ncbi:hypothetical protein BDZ97DRAFT_1758768 [Flammula alnicola]|nr:hypothetical protein BDZ97DRAFT_1758768 [Flammula alnicola]
MASQSYDEQLLASAPVATKAQLQSGYNPDLLVEKTPPASSSRHDLEDGRDFGQTPRPEPDGKPLPPKAPFYRTKKGIIIIVVALVVVIAAVVGGAVGGSRKKTNNQSTSQSVSSQAPANASSSGASDNSQAGGSVPASGTSGAQSQTTVSATTLQSRIALPPFPTSPSSQGGVSL